MLLKIGVILLDVVVLYSLWDLAVCLILNVISERNAILTLLILGVALVLISTIIKIYIGG